MDKKFLDSELTTQFQWFHAHPELSYEEYATTDKIRALLTAKSIEILDTPLDTGLVAIIRGAHPGPVIALRSDIDALPVGEQTDLPYKSQNQGKMHACGHDFHIAALYGAALLLKEQESKLHGTVKLLFQPAEESSLGATGVIKTHVLDDVSAIFGIHASPKFEVGTIGIKTGSLTSSVDRFEITLNGSGTHGAKPHEGKDPIVATGALISSLQTIASRNLDPFAAGLLSITHLQAGNTWNVIPEKSYMEGTVRTLNKHDRDLFAKRVKEIAEYTAKAYDVSADVVWHAGPPATDNDPFWTDFAIKTAKENDLHVKICDSSMLGEDFAFYQEAIKGAFMWIGTGLSYPNHHPKFQVNPKALAPTSIYLSDLAQKALKEINK